MDKEERTLWREYDTLEETEVIGTRAYGEEADRKYDTLAETGLTLEGRKT